MNWFMIILHLHFFAVCKSFTFIIIVTTLWAVTPVDKSRNRGSAMSTCQRSSSQEAAKPELQLQAFWPKSSVLPKASQLSWIMKAWQGYRDTPPHFTDEDPRPPAQGHQLAYTNILSPTWSRPKLSLDRPMLNATLVSVPKKQIRTGTKPLKIISRSNTSKCVSG